MPDRPNVVSLERPNRDLGPAKHGEESPFSRALTIPDAP